jgi:15-cis-phytoene synthase
MNSLIALRESSPSRWEENLSIMALAAHDCSGHGLGIDVAPQLLAQAYETSARITAAASRTFSLASGLLPPAKRQGARALYAFCRVSDDLVDHTGNLHQANHAGSRGNICVWRERILAPELPLDDPVALAWADTRARYNIPVCLIEQFFDGVSADLHRSRYQTFDELAEYAYGVASTVGLMVMHIIGYIGPEAIPFAVKLGVALQITNILRDVAEDWQVGRLYLPLEELHAYGLGEADIAKGRVDDRWTAFMRFQVERNRQLYAEAAPGIAMLHPDGRLAIQAAADLYAGILDDIERHGYDTFARRSHVGAWGKLRRIPGIWWRSWHDIPAIPVTVGRLTDPGRGRVSTHATAPSGTTTR